MPSLTSAAVDDMARSLVDWVDTETELPPADLAELALGTLDGKAPTVKTFVRCMWLRRGSGKETSFDMRPNRAQRSRTEADGPAHGFVTDGTDRVDVTANDVAAAAALIEDENEEARALGAAAMLALTVAGEHGSGESPAEAADADTSEATTVRLATMRTNAEAERNHRYGLTMLTLAQISMIGSRKNVPNLRKLRGLIDHATRTPRARIDLGSILHERGSQRDTDAALLARAGRVAVAALGGGDRDVMDSIDNASFQACSMLERLRDPPAPPRTSSRERLRLTQLDYMRVWVLFLL